MIKQVEHVQQIIVMPKHVDVMDHYEHLMDHINMQAVHQMEIPNLVVYQMEQEVNHVQQTQQVDEHVQ